MSPQPPYVRNSTWSFEISNTKLGLPLRNANALHCNAISSSKFIFSPDEEFPPLSHHLPSLSHPFPPLQSARSRKLIGNYLQSRNKPAPTTIARAPPTRPEEDDRVGAAGPTPKRTTQDHLLSAAKLPADREESEEGALAPYAEEEPEEAAADKDALNRAAAKALQEAQAALTAEIKEAERKYAVYADAARRPGTAAPQAEAYLRDAERFKVQCSDGYLGISIEEIQILCTRILIYKLSQRLLSFLSFKFLFDPRSTYFFRFRALLPAPPPQSQVRALTKRLLALEEGAAPRTQEDLDDELEEAQETVPYASYAPAKLKEGCVRQARIYPSFMASQASLI